MRFRVLVGEVEEHAKTKTRRTYSQPTTFGLPKPCNSHSGEHVDVSSMAHLLHPFLSISHSTNALWASMAQATRRGLVIDVVEDVLQIAVPLAAFRQDRRFRLSKKGALGRTASQLWNWTSWKVYDTHAGHPVNGCIVWRNTYTRNFLCTPDGFVRLYFPILCTLDVFAKCFSQRPSRNPTPKWYKGQVRERQGM